MTIAIILIVAVVVLVGVALMVSYNRFVKQRNQIQESWRQIDVELHRRYDLIPNLVETVRAFAAHERHVFEEVARLRTQAQGAQNAAPEDRAQAEQALSAGLRQLMVTVEAYPQVQSNQNFLNLQNELTATEDRIAAGRRFYNANVRGYNTRIDAFPSNVIAGRFKFSKAGYFEVEDADVRAVPQVAFGSIGSVEGEQMQQQMNQPGSSGGVQPQMPGSDEHARPAQLPRQDAPQPQQQQQQQQQPQPQSGPQSYGPPQQQPGQPQSAGAGDLPGADQGGSGPPAGSQRPQDGQPPFTGGG